MHANQAEFRPLVLTSNFARDHVYINFSLGTCTRVQRELRRGGGGRRGRRSKGSRPVTRRPCHRVATPFISPPATVCTRTQTPSLAFQHCPPKDVVNHQWGWLSAHSEHRFPAPSSKGCREPPVGLVECTLRASLSGTFLQTLPDLVTPLKGHSLSPRTVHRRGQRPSKVRVLIKLQALVDDILPTTFGGRCRKAMLGVWVLISISVHI